MKNFKCILHSLVVTRNVTHQILLMVKLCECMYITYTYIAIWAIASAVNVCGTCSYMRWLNYNQICNAHEKKINAGVYWNIVYLWEWKNRYVIWIIWSNLSSTLCYFVWDFSWSCECISVCNKSNISHRFILWCNVCRRGFGLMMCSKWDERKIVNTDTEFLLKF